MDSFNPGDVSSNPARVTVEATMARKVTEKPSHKIKFPRSGPSSLVSPMLKIEYTVLFCGSMVSSIFLGRTSSSSSCEEVKWMLSCSLIKLRKRDVDQVYHLIILRQSAFQIFPLFWCTYARCVLCFIINSQFLASCFSSKRTRLSSRSALI